MLLLSRFSLSRRPTQTRHAADKLRVLWGDLCNPIQGDLHLLHPMEKSTLDTLPVKCSLYTRLRGMNGYMIWLFQIIKFEVDATVSMHGAHMMKGQVDTHMPEICKGRPLPRPLIAETAICLSSKLDHRHFRALLSSIGSGLEERRREYSL